MTKVGKEAKIEEEPLIEASAELCGEVLSEAKDKPKPKPKKDEFRLDVDEMMSAGLHFGHRVSRVHPKMQPYISSTRNTVHLINLEKTVEKLREALKFIRENVEQGKIILFVGTKIQVKNMVKELAEIFGLPYITERWLGGTFTNLEVLKKRIKYFKELEEMKTSGGLEKYPKKEKMKMEQVLRNLRIKFEGIKNMTDLPEAIFVLDMKRDYLAVKEARAKGVKVIGIADTNVDPTLADYPIPANDDAISSVKYILDKVKEVIADVKSKT